MDSEALRAYFYELQDNIVGTLGEIDGQPFRSVRWKREPGERLEGEGLTRVLEGGGLLERGGCNFSHVHGRSLPPSATAHRPELAGAAFEAMGVSLVFHPRNPYVPTVHMNVRVFAALPAGRDPVVWFGGGMDLTPYYGFEEDAVHFHRTCAEAVAPFGPDHYPRFKRWCDEYFYLPHRKEPRGVGGIFYDNLESGDFEANFSFTRDVGLAVLDAFPRIVRRAMNSDWTQAERDEQLVRRGRYVEFNLVYDRGTKFGLATGGNTEAILMSLPPEVRWP